MTDWLSTKRRIQPNHHKPITFYLFSFSKQLLVTHCVLLYSPVLTSLGHVTAEVSVCWPLEELGRARCFNSALYSQHKAELLQTRLISADCTSFLDSSYCLCLHSTADGHLPLHTSADSGLPLILVKATITGFSRSPFTVSYSRNGFSSGCNSFEL